MFVRDLMNEPTAGPDHHRSMMDLMNNLSAPLEWMGVSITLAARLSPSRFDWRD
jgi:hypothetical protein